MEEIFTYNPNLEVVFATSDNQVFYNESDAKNYAKSLENTKVEKLENPNLHLEIEVNFEEEVPGVLEPTLQEDNSTPEKNPKAEGVPAVDEPTLEQEDSAPEETSKVENLEKEKKVVNLNSKK